MALVKPLAEIFSAKSMQSKSLQLSNKNNYLLKSTLTEGIRACGKKTL